VYRIYGLSDLMVPVYLGLSVYALYLRVNADKSKSESVAQLASNVPYGSGQEVNLEPGVLLQIKVSHNCEHTLTCMTLYAIEA